MIDYRLGLELDDLFALLFFLSPIFTQPSWMLWATFFLTAHEAVPKLAYTILVPKYGVGRIHDQESDDTGTGVPKVSDIGPIKIDRCSTSTGILVPELPRRSQDNNTFWPSNGRPHFLLLPMALLFRNNLPAVVCASVDVQFCVCVCWFA